MTKDNIKKNGSHARRRALGIGLGAATLTAGATAAYFLTGKRGEHNRRRLKAWMIEARNEVASRLNEAKEMSEERYYQIVEQAMNRYRNLRDASPEEIAAFVSDLRRSWKNIKTRVERQPSVPQGSRPVRRRVKARRTKTKPQTESAS